MSVKLVAHLMKVDLSTFSQEKVGALHGRIFRSVDGFVRFLRLSFLDFIPAILTGLFALTAVVMKQPIIGLVMLCVAPFSIFLTVRQLITRAPWSTSSDTVRPERVPDPYMPRPSNWATGEVAV